MLGIFSFGTIEVFVLTQKLTVFSENVPNLTAVAFKTSDYLLTLRKIFSGSAKKNKHGSRLKNNTIVQVFP